METQNRPPGTFAPTFDAVADVCRLLQIAIQRCEDAQSQGADRYVEEAVADLAEALSDHVVALALAHERDLLEAEQSGRAEYERRAEHPLRAA
jgi:hypothetical protein